MPPASTTYLTAGQVMDRTASLMNDTAKAVYTYVVVLPYLNMAIDNLQEELENSEMSPTSKTSNPVITVTAGIDKVRSVEWPPPNYPFDLIEIQQIWERLAGSNDSFIPMTRREFLSHSMDNLPVDSLREWTWLEQEIQFYEGGASTDRELRLDYIRAPLILAQNENSQISAINARSFLSFKTAEYCARYVGENSTRADQLQGDADKALDKIMGISVKGRQSFQVRRRPFRAAYKRRSFI